ncbi:MAG: 50S ribosomal protein L25/general stress protein Ctc [Gemmatimonadota bacterium]
MAQDVVLQAESRAVVGKGSARQLRRDGYIPAVVYGHGEDTVNLKIKAEELDALLGSIQVGSTLVDLKVSGAKTRKVLIREVQRHPFKPEIFHVDFFHIAADEKIRVEVPVRLTGRAAASEEGGILQQIRHSVPVECLPEDIPEVLELDVSALNIGDSLHIRDLETGGVTILDELDLTVCTVVPPTVMAVEEEEEVEEGEMEGVEPEVIGREADQEDTGEEADDT